MNIVIRTDASIEIGSGHFMRCLTLADRLRSKGATVSFISRELPGNLCDMAEKKGHGVYRLAFSGQETAEIHGTPSHARWLGVTWETDADETRAVLQRLSPPAEWLVVDHYALDKQWETRMRPFTRNIMVIDDIADRPHDCDVLLDQNLYPDMETRYNGLIPPHCKKLLGPSHALLRPQFIEARKNLRKRDGSVKRILIFFGGSDPTNETAKALEATAMLNRPDIAVDVVVGNANPHKELIRRRCNAMPNTTFYCQVENMAELMSRADLAIGAGGSASWERCFLGLPTITMSVANNQIATTQELARQGATIYLGNGWDTDSEKLTIMLSDVIKDPMRLLTLGHMAFNIVGHDKAIVTDTIFGCCTMNA